LSLSLSENTSVSITSNDATTNSTPSAKPAAGPTRRRPTVPLEIPMVESSGFDLHEPDEWLPGSITRISETDDNGYGPGLKWEMQLDEEEWDTWAFSSQKLSVKSKLYKWLTAINPETPPTVGDTVDLADLIGRRVEVTFERVQRDGAERETVTKIRAEKTKDGYGKGSTLPAKQREAAAAKKVAEDEAPF